MRTSLFRSATAAVKNTLPAALLLGFLSLAFAPAANAQLTFTVNEFTANSLSLTIHAGSLLTTNGPEDEGAVELILTDASGSNGTWINSDVALSGGGNFGSISQLSMRANDSANDAIELQWEDDLSSVGDLGTDLTYTVTSTGLFNPDNVSSWRLTWGNPLWTFNVQSVGTAVTGGGSAVPEPSTYAALFGLISLGFAACRRRRSLRH